MAYIWSYCNYLLLCLSKQQCTVICSDIDYALALGIFDLGNGSFILVILGYLDGHAASCVSVWNLPSLQGLTTSRWRSNINTNTIVIIITVITTRSVLEHSRQQYHSNSLRQVPQHSISFPTQKFIYLLLHWEKSIDQNLTTVLSPPHYLDCFSFVFKLYETVLPVGRGMINDWKMIIALHASAFFRW